MKCINQRNQSQNCVEGSFKPTQKKKNPKAGTKNFFVPYSILTGAQYVTLHIKIRWRKSNIQYAGVAAQENQMVFLLHICSVRWGWYKAVHMLEKSVINMIWLLLPVFDLPIMMIGPGGLLLVVPTYLQSSFQFYWLGCQKNK
jgi:hypothetical protein